MCATYLRIGRYPIGSFTIVIAFLLPSSEQLAPDWIMPVFTAVKTNEMTQEGTLVLATTNHISADKTHNRQYKPEDMATNALDRPGFNILHLNGIVAVGRWTPPQQSVALPKGGYNITLSEMSWKKLVD